MTEHLVGGILFFPILHIVINVRDPGMGEIYFGNPLLKIITSEVDHK